MNGRIAPIAVPPAFIWKDEASGESLPVLWHWHGYGKDHDPGNPVRLPGSSHAVVYLWRNDNQGPPESADEVLGNKKELEKQFPGAKVISSTL